MSNEPVDPTVEKNVDEVEKQPEEKPQKYQFAMFILTATVMIMTMLTLVSGQWLKLDGANRDTTEQYDLWGKCTCQATDLTFQCSEIKRLVKAAQAFSVLSVCLQFGGVIALAVSFLAIAPTAGARVVGLIMSWFAIVTLVISWAAWLGMYKGRFCGTRLEDEGDLHWAFALRVAESLLQFIAALLLTIATKRNVSFKRVALLIAVMVLVMSIATTAGRGWSMSGLDNSKLEKEMSLFESCTCLKVNDFTCNDERRVLRGAQAMSVMGVFVQFLLIVFVLFALPAVLHAVFAAFTAICFLAAWAMYANWFDRQYCGQPAADATYALYWPFGLNVVAFIIQTVAFTVAVTAACGQFE